MMVTLTRAAYLKELFELSELMSGGESPRFQQVEKLKLLRLTCDELLMKSLYMLFCVMMLLVFPVLADSIATIQL